MAYADHDFEALYDDVLNHYANVQPWQESYQNKLDNTVEQIDSYAPYKGIYDKGIKNNLRQLYNWDYDPESDKSFQAMKQVYTNNGTQAMNDTLAQVSSRTGGLASSYAGKAAQDSYNGYMQQLNSLLPQYEQNAYNRVLTGLGAMQNQDNTDYSRWQNNLSNLYNKGNLLSGLQSNQIDYLGSMLNTTTSAWQTLMQMAMANAAAAGGGYDDGGGYYGGGYYAGNGNATSGNPYAGVNNPSSAYDFAGTQYYDYLVTPKSQGGEGMTPSAARQEVVDQRKNVGLGYNYNPLWDIK